MEAALSGEFGYDDPPLPKPVPEKISSGSDDLAGANGGMGGRLLGRGAGALANKTGAGRAGDGIGITEIGRGGTLVPSCELLVDSGDDGTTLTGAGGGGGTGRGAGAGATGSAAGAGGADGNARMAGALGALGSAGGGGTVPAVGKLGALDGALLGGSNRAIVNHFT